MAADWIRRMERAVRRFGGELAVDSFLPDLQHLEAATNLAPEPDGTWESAELGAIPFSERGDSLEPPPPSASEDAAAQDTENLDEEIRAFMNRDDRDASDDDDLSDFLGQGIDPNVDI